MNSNRNSNNRLMMADHRNRKRGSKKAGLAALIFATILLASCPPPTPDPIPTPDPAPTAPAAPVLTFTAGDGTVTLSWDEVTRAVSYRIYRDSTDTPLVTTPETITRTEYTDTGLDNGEDYTYTVQAVGSTGLVSPHSNPVTATPDATPDAPPAAPGLTAILSATGDTVMLSWTADDDATGYHIYRAVDGAEAMRLETDPNPYRDTTYPDSDVVRGTAYSYTVRALKGDLRSEPSDPATADPPTVAPNLSIEVGDTQLTLTWNEVTGATSYNVYRVGATTSPLATITDLSNRTHIDTSLENGTEYTYTVTSTGSNGVESAASDPPTAATPLPPPPSPPEGLMAVAGDRTVTLSWNAVADATTYRIYRSSIATGFANPALIGTVTVTDPDPELMYVDNPLTNGTTYAYRITVEVRPFGFVSPLSEEQRATPITPPGVPRNLIAFPVTEESVWLSWDEVDGVDAYRIYRVGAATSPLATITDLSNLTHLDTGLSTGTAYTYTVTAVIGTLESAASDPPATATPNLINFANLRNAGSDNPRGIWSNDTTMWIVDQTDRILYAYILATGVRDPAKDINLVVELEEFEFPDFRGIWSDGATMWVADSIIDEEGTILSKHISAYNLTSGVNFGARDPDNDFSDATLGTDITRVTDLWSNKNIPDVAEADATMWVLDSGTDKIYAYNLSSKSRDSSEDINLHTGDPADTRDNGNANPLGIWSDGATIWVSDWQDDKFYAYNLDSGAYTPGADFNTLAIGHSSPSHIWSDGTTLWGVDFIADILYRYVLNTRMPE